MLGDNRKSHLMRKAKTLLGEKRRERKRERLADLICQNFVSKKRYEKDEEGERKKERWSPHP